MSNRTKRSNGAGSLYQRKGSRVWVGSYFQADGSRKTRSTGATCKATSRRILDAWVATEALRREGLIDPAAERYRNADARPIGEHSDAWRRHLESKGSTPDHCAKMHSAVARALNLAQVERLRELTVERAQDALRILRSKGFAPRTLNYTRTALRGFTRWAHHSDLIRSDVLSRLPAVREAEKRRERRALQPAEITWLLTYTEDASAFGGVAGADRATLYRVALGTGFRASELRALRVRDFDLDRDAPAVLLAATDSKRRLAERQPIRRDLADILRKYLAGKPPAACALRVPGRTAEALRLDLRRARARWIRDCTEARERRQRRSTDFLAITDPSGRVADFHALRTTYITLLVKGGASTKVAQMLARHSDPKLTLNVYTKLGLSDLEGALEALPGEVASDEQAVALATGTDDSARSAHVSNSSAVPLIGVHTGASDSGGLRIAGNAGKACSDAKLGASAQRSAPSCVNSPARIRTGDRAIMSRVL